MNKQVFACLGLPCSGKGTQSRILADNFHAHRIESGARLDMIIRGEIYLQFQQSAKMIRKNPERVRHGIKGKITRAQIGDTSKIKESLLILDGFGRSMNQYEIICDIFGRDNITILLFNISQDTMFKRAQDRWIDPKTGKSYRGISSPSEANQIGLVKRDSDKLGILRKRVTSFKGTKKVIENHRELGGGVIDINAGNPVEVVTKEMMKKVGEMFPDLRA